MVIQISLDIPDSDSLRLVRLDLYFHRMLDTDAEVGAIDPVHVADFEAAKTEVIGENENAMFTSAGDQGPVQAVERDYPFSMRSRISAWLMESSPSRSRVSPSA